MIILLIITIVLIIVSFLFDRNRTRQGIKKGILMFLNMLFPFLSVLVLVSVILSFISNEIITQWLGNESGPYGFMSAALVGSISLIPGFIAYPLCSILIKKGVSYAVIAVFITTLSMVGILTFPLEAKYFGWKIGITRNVLSFAAAILIGFAIGIIWRFL